LFLQKRGPPLEKKAPIMKEIVYFELNFVVNGGFLRIFLWGSIDKSRHLAFKCD
jgi:hypothetical protein